MKKGFSLQRGKNQLNIHSQELFTNADINGNAGNFENVNEKQNKCSNE